MPSAATFKLPSLVGQASPLVIIMSGEDARPTIGAGGVAANLHTPLSPLFRVESQKIENSLTLNLVVTIGRDKLYYTNIIENLCQE